MRAGKAERTARKAEDGDRLTGWPRLMQLLGPAGEAVVRRALDWLARIIHAPRREKCVDECKAWKPQGFRALPGIVPAKQPARRQTLPVPLPHATAAQRLGEARTSCATWEGEGSRARRRLRVQDAGGTTMGGVVPGRRRPGREDGDQRA
jgi:hypothetical protein